MAPISIRIAHAMLEVKIEARSVGSMNSAIPAPPSMPGLPAGLPPLVATQASTLIGLSLAFSAISVASATLALYWFVRMRRTFRHDLIMLLIQSDMFKALWTMIFPAVILTQGPISNEFSPFCQAHRFFLALSIEASDFAILMIAIHSALYIFQPGGSRREGGLYPYRHIVYTLWVMFPITMAGLGFINGNGPGVDPSTNCYLPIRPFWYRLVLSWVPRYIIFLSIMGIYVSIYFFVRKKFHGFDKEGKSRTERLNSPPNGNRGSKRQKRHCIPSTPTLTCHGLIPQASRQNPVATDADVVAEARKKSASTSDFDQSSLLFKTGTTRFIWESIFTNNRSSEEAPPSDDLYTIDSNSFTGPVTPRPLPAYLGPSPPTPNDVEFVNPSQFRVTSWRAEFVSRVTFSPSHSPASKRSTADIFSILRRGPPDMSTETQTPISQLHLVTSRGQNLPASAMLRTREKIRRQLRLSFVYPLVYMGMWILPFVADVLLFEDPMTISPPFALGCAAAIFGCSQAAVDSWLFFTREKPWKHIHETDGSFWGSLKFWSGWNGVRRKRRKREPGKTRDEMVRDSRAAYHRREEELAQRRLVAVQGAQSGGDRRDRSWWEAEGLDGPIETVQEESADPDEDVESNSRQSSDDETDLPSPEASEEKDEIKEEPLIWPAHTINAKDELSTENGQEG